MPPPILLDKSHQTVAQNRQYLKQNLYSLLEKIIDTSCRIGLDINPVDQSILTSVLHGDSYSHIAAEFDIKPSEVPERALKAYQQLEQFLNRLVSEEELQQQFSQQKESLVAHYNEQFSKKDAEINRLRSENSSLSIIIKKFNNAPENFRSFAMQVPIHKLPFSAALQSILFREGLYTIKEIISHPTDEVKSYFDTAPALWKELNNYISNTLNLRFIDNPDMSYAIK